MTATNLKLRPILEPPDRRIGREPEPQPRSGVRTVLIAGVLGLVTGLAVKGLLGHQRYAQASGRVEIHTTTADQQGTALARHLGRLYLASVPLPDDHDPKPANIVDLVAEGRLRVFARNEKTITIVASDSSASRAADLVERIQAGYIHQVETEKKRQTDLASKINTEQADRQKQLEDEYHALKRDLKKFTATDSNPSSFDQAIVGLGKQLEASLDAARDLNETLLAIKDDMYRAEGELRSPTVHLPDEHVEQAARADRQYAGDGAVLELKHRAYVHVFQREAKQAEDALQAVRNHLKVLSQSASKQLELNLPAELADDLLELNLAVGLYEGQLESYSQRWRKYLDEMADMTASARTADYAEVQTVLSRMRQDLNQRCGKLPTHMQELFDRLKSPPQSDARKPGRLSRAAVRNIASSVVQYDLESVLAAWKSLVFHLDRMFPESNVQLRSLGRICRSLQARISKKRETIRQRMEQEYLEAARREARKKLDVLQVRFQQTSADVVKAYERLDEDQRKLCKLTRRWPDWQQLNTRITQVAVALEDTRSNLASSGVEIWTERLEADDVTTATLSHAGLFGQHENATSVIAGLCVAALAYLLAGRRNTALP